ncbi:MAG: fibrobacter succinogenes major paralogous domain-containing protein [Bacteroidales bacterium]|nr:fibrobacter succinogenes major paralogous domain-containing protein [Bacteroidales bacterium]
MAITTGCAQQPSKTSDPGVIINGIRWATRNVATPGTFADKPEDAGMFYQWNRKKAWNATDSIVVGWDTSMPEGDEWEKDNDPSPKGWRIPTMEEFASLCDEDKVNIEWTTQNSVKGMKFTDKANGNSIFLPAAIHRYPYDGQIPDVGTGGFYWSSTINEEYTTLAYHLFFMRGEINSGYTSATDGGTFICGFSLRCVAE